MVAGLLAQPVSAAAASEPELPSPWVGRRSSRQAPGHKKAQADLLGRRIVDSVLLIKALGRDWNPR